MHYVLTIDLDILDVLEITFGVLQLHLSIVRYFTCMQL